MSTPNDNQNDNQLPDVRVTFDTAQRPAWHSEAPDIEGIVLDDMARLFERVFGTTLDHYSAAYRLFFAEKLRRCRCHQRVGRELLISRHARRCPYAVFVCVFASRLELDSAPLNRLHKRERSWLNYLPAIKHVAGIKTIRRAVGRPARALIQMALNRSNVAREIAHNYFAQKRHT